MDSKETECCPRFDPEPWQGKTHTWEGRKFIKDKVFSIFYMPVNMDAVMTRLNAKAEQANALTKEMLCLSDHTSLFNTDEYLEVTKEVPGAENVEISGEFISKVYEGDYSKTGEWTKDFDTYITGKNLKISKMYMWYTTCPKCAKKYGKNYTVIIGKIQNA